LFLDDGDDDAILSWCYEADADDPLLQERRTKISFKPSDNVTHPKPDN
jgi:hypothetical protein